jgi:hypothetical protein
MIVRKELIFLLIRPVLVKVDRFSDEQEGRQAGSSAAFYHQQLHFIGSSW